MKLKYELKDMLIGDTKKSPIGDLGVKKNWHCWWAANRNPGEALRYE